MNFRDGTARSLRTNFVQFPVFGKTGTCSNNGTRFGWFVSYGDAPTGRIVTVIFLEGGRRTFGPKAAELTGQFYRAMYERNYFAVQAGDGCAGGNRRRRRSSRRCAYGRNCCILMDEAVCHDEDSYSGRDGCGGPAVGGGGRAGVRR